MTNDERNPKPQFRKKLKYNRRVRHSDFDIPSDFVIRHSDLSIAFMDRNQKRDSKTRAVLVVALS